MKQTQQESKSVWSQALLDCLGGDIREAHLPGDEIAPEFQNETEIRYYATNSGGWSANLAKKPF